LKNERQEARAERPSQQAKSERKMDHLAAASARVLECAALMAAGYHLRSAGTLTDSDAEVRPPDRVIRSISHC